MQKSICSLFLCFILALQLQAQPGRRAFLGTALYTLNDSLVQLHQLSVNQGVLVNRVVEKSSAEFIGLQKGDVIVSINGKKMETQTDVSSYIASHRAGDTIMVAYFRAEELRQVEAPLQPFPYETSPYAEVIYDGFPFADGQVRTIIRRPIAEGKHPVLFYIQGAHCGSMDGLYTTDPVARLIEGFARKGYVVVKTEKLGVGDSQNHKNCKQCDLMEEVALFSESYNQLAKYDFIDLDNVFVFGHSMGGVQAPLMETDFPPKGIAVFGTIARPWFEYYMDIARKQRLLLGQDFLENELHVERATRFYYSLMIDQKTPRELLEDEDLKDFMYNQWNYDGHEGFYGRHYTFWQQLQDARVISAWSRSPAHVLSIWGEGEFVALNSFEHELIADIVNHYNPGKARYVRMPGIDHGFVKVADLQHAIDTRRDWHYKHNNFNEDIVGLVHEWMQEVMGE